MGSSGAAVSMDVVVELVLGFRVLHVRADNQFQAWLPQTFDPGKNLFRVADNCVQVMGGTGVTRDTIVEQVFREVRAFRIYDGPTEVHLWSLAKRIKKETLGRLHP